MVPVRLFSRRVAALDVTREILAFMHWFVILLGLLCCSLVATDAIQTVVIPRRPSGRFRITRFFFVFTWTPWVFFGERFRNHKTREQFYGAYGPISLIFLLLFWAALLTFGFALILYGFGTPYQDASLASNQHTGAHFLTDIYVSGTSLTTLGPGDVVPRRQIARMLMIVESGTGLGLVALVISYVPVLYAAFSRREVSVALLDSRAGSPPTAAELLTRHGFEGGANALITLLAEWERWSADILESHISYPVLCYYRSQHDNQSWLSALTTILDVCALLITTIEGPASRQAQLTFAMARHAVVDLGHVFRIEIDELAMLNVTETNRLTDATFARLCDSLSAVDIGLCTDSNSAHRLLAIRQLYEPRAQALADYLQMPLPQWISDPKPTDQWRKVSSLRFGALGGKVSVNTEHISSESTAMNLHDTETHGL